MKKISLLFFLVLSLAFVPVHDVKAKTVKEVKSSHTTVVIVRHAEKAAYPHNDPPLTEEGEERAKTLARMLSKSGVSVVFSTNYIRTRETVNNYADPRGIKIEIYNTPVEVADLIKSHYVGKAVLVAGHSNTVSSIIKALGLSSAPRVNNEYNNFFIVTICPNGVASLTHLKY